MREVAKDPVCGMQVKVDGAKWVGKYGGRSWYFCSQGCRKKFEVDPGRYDGSRPVEVAASGLNVLGEGTPAKVGSCCGSGGGTASTPDVIASAGGYTCPMHPQIVS